MRDVLACLICCLAGTIVGREEYEASFSCCLYRQSKESLQRSLNRATAAHAFNPLFVFWVEIFCSLDMSRPFCIHFVHTTLSDVHVSNDWIDLIWIYMNLQCFICFMIWFTIKKKILEQPVNFNVLDWFGLSSSLRRWRSWIRWRWGKLGFGVAACTAWRKQDSADPGMFFSLWSSRFHLQTLVIQDMGISWSPEFRCCYNILLDTSNRFETNLCQVAWEATENGWKVLNTSESERLKDVKRIQNTKICMAGGQGALLDTLEDAMT